MKTTTLSLPSWKIWTLATRPKTLIASISPVLIGGALSVTSASFHPLLLLMTMIVALGIQIGTNFANDYFDCLKGADTSERVGPLRVTQAGLLSHQAIRKGFILVFALSALASVYLIFHGGWLIASLMSLSILLGIIYTAGPCSIAYTGLGEVFVFFFFGPIATAGTYYLQTGIFSFEAFLAGIGPGALSNGILVVNNLRDEKQDRLVDKKTLVVRFGTLFGKIEYTIFALMALSVPCLFWSTHPLLPLMSLTMAGPTLLLCMLIWRAKEAKDFSTIFPHCGKLLVLYTFLFLLGWLL